VTRAGRLLAFLQADGGLIELNRATILAKRERLLERMTSRMRCDMNEAVLRVTPRVR